MAKIKKAAKELYQAQVKLASAKAKKPRQKKYTDEERKRLASLRNQKTYYNKRVASMKSAYTIPNVYTLQDMRKQLSQEDAQRLFYEGYFDPDNKSDYENRDFREWMIDDGNEDLLDEIIDSINENLGDDDLKISKYDDPIYEDDKYKEYMKKLSDIEKEINNIKGTAEDRKTANKAKEAYRKNAEKFLTEMPEDIEQAKAFIESLPKSEKEAVKYVQKSLARAVVSQMDFSEMSDRDAAIAKTSLYNTIAVNPIEGLRSALKETVMSDIAEKYGDNFAGVAGSVVDLVTGKGSIQSVGVKAFDAMLYSKGIKGSLAKEIAEGLINDGKSTPEEQNVKTLGVDIVTDLVRDVIKSGGNLYAAAPMFAKDVISDLLHFGARDADIKKSKLKEEKANKNEDKNEDKKSTAGGNMEKFLL